MLNYEEIRAYWNSRAASDPSVQSTTQDVYLREIELSVLTERIERLRPGSTADFGCGDGRTTARLAGRFRATRFLGLDYSSSMIDNARQRIQETGLENLEFVQGDVTGKIDGQYDLAFTTRCLINLPSWGLQQRAIRNIHRCLARGGRYILIENFVEGHENFNRVRSAFGLPEIAVRQHNLFFSRKSLVSFLDGLFELEAESNISSLYYLVSRVVYSAMCSENGTTPDYFHDLHRLSAGLPHCGEFGPVRMMCLKKKQD